MFLSEGIQKFLFPAALATGRFAKIGIPFPQFSGPFVGVVEIVCGTLLVVGFFTRCASIPHLIDIAVAIATTKFPMMLKQGFWAAMHEGRTDFCMLVGLISRCCFLEAASFLSTRSALVVAASLGPSGMNSIR